MHENNSLISCLLLNVDKNNCKYHIDKDKNQLIIQLPNLINPKENLTIEDIKTLWNDWAKKNGKPQIKIITGKRLLSIKSALKDYPRKEDWQAMLQGISKDPFWFSIIDFDKLYRNERYHEFYEKGSQLELSIDPLESFFNKYKDKK